MTTEFHVYTDGIDTIFGTDLGEALAVYGEGIGLLPTDFCRDDWEQVPDDKPITIRDTDKDFGWEGGKKTLTASEWISYFASITIPAGSCPRLICSTEY